jgi:hypothetical protein
VAEASRARRGEGAQRRGAATRVPMRGAWAPMHGAQDSAPDHANSNEWRNANLTID